MSSPPGRHILVIHHDADLYGADQSLLRTLRALQRSGQRPIVLLPHDGPLVPLLQAEGFELHIGPVGKLSRQLMRPIALPRLVGDMIASVRFVGRAVAGRSIALAYTNSVAALGGAIWAWLHRTPRLWHVREIVVTPRAAAAGFPALLRVLGGWCVCNSRATRQWLLGHQPVLAQRSSVIWNGLEAVSRPSAHEAAAFRTEQGYGPDDVVVTLIGRINRWKGQGVLIDAAALLRQRGQAANLRFLIVGDVADGQHHFREAMLAQIEQRGVQDIVRWHPFTPLVDRIWAGSNIAVVPSTEPEPFGRVAIEAMAQGLPVVAANHGGLSEIVDPGVTGLLVTPGSVEALADAIQQLAADAPRRQAMGQAGATRQLSLFTQEEHDRRVIDLIDTLAAGRAPLAEPVATLT